MLLGYKLVAADDFCPYAVCSSLF